MSKIFSILFLIFISQCGLHAQITFQKTYGGAGGDGGNQVFPTYDNGFIIIGYTRSFGEGDKDFFVIKTDEEGNLMWSKTYGGPLKDAGDYASIYPTNDLGYIICGPTNSFGLGGGDLYLIKINSLGDTLWTSTIGNGGVIQDGGFSIQQTTDNGFIAAGYTNYGGTGDYLVKLNSAGNMLWNKKYGGGIAYSVQETTDGGFIIGGTTAVYGAGLWDFRLIKTNSNGDTLWTKTYGGNNYENLNSVRQTTNGGYILSGYSRSFGAGGDEIYVVRTDTVGNIKWSKTYGSANYDIGAFAEETHDGGFIIVGQTNNKLCLIKTNSLGDTVWTKVYGNASNGRFVKQLPNKDFIITGDMGNDVCLIRTDSLGNTGCSETSAGVIVLNASTQIGTGATILSQGYQARSETIITVPNFKENTICIENNCSLQVDLDINNLTQECTGTITVYVSGGTSNYSYSWDANANFQTTQTATNLCLENYCVTITDMSGCSIDTCVSGIITNLTNRKDISVSIFPNPANDIFTINFPKNFNDGFLKIYDFAWRQVASYELIERETTINHNLQSGIYFTVVSDENNIIYFSKLIISDF